MLAKGCSGIFLVFSIGNGIFRAMPQKKFITVVDKSRLAWNIYNLILNGVGLKLKQFSTFDDLLESGLGKEEISLIIVNSNVFGKQFEKIKTTFSDDKRFAGLDVIYLCNESEKTWQERLVDAKNAKILMKPFKPNELLNIVEKKLI